MGDYPYNAISDPEILKKIKSGPPRFSEKYDITEESKDFIRKCLTIDPKKRITWKAMYEHPLLSDKNKNMRQTYLCSINSKISMNKNKEFYEKQPDINPMNQFQPAFEFQKANL
jgi:serine/threonine protein kinase